MLISIIVKTNMVVVLKLSCMRIRTVPALCSAFGITCCENKLSFKTIWLV